MLILSCRFASAMLLLFVITALPLRASDGAPPPSERNVVLFMASFPRSWEQSLYEALRSEVSRAETCKGIRIEYIETMADRDVTVKALSRIDSATVLASIQAGDRFASLAPELAHHPAIVLSPSTAFTEEPTIAGDASASPTLRLGVLPPFEHCRTAFERLRPLPDKMALVYSLDSKSDGDFAASFQSHYAALVSSESTPTLCPVSLAACQNLNDMAACIQRYLSGLDERDIAIVLPGQNTIKFAYMFRSFAEERKIGLVGVGESAISPALLTIDYSPAEIARYCLDHVAHLRTDGAWRSSKTATLTPRVTLNSAVASLLGYSRSEPSTSGDSGKPVQ